MKKLLLILLYLPMIGFGQDIRVFSKCDIIINHILKNTASFINKNNQPKSDFKFHLIQQKTLIDWNEYKFSKWKIIEKTGYKIMIKTIY